MDPITLFFGLGAVLFAVMVIIQAAKLPPEGRTVFILAGVILVINALTIWFVGK